MDNVRKVVQDIGRYVKWPISAMDNEVAGWVAIVLFLGIFIKLFVF